MEAHEMHYSLVIKWEPQGKVYVVSVPEMPGCVTHGETYQEAITQAMDAIDTWAIDVDPKDWPKPDIYDVGDLDADPLTEEDILASAEAARQAK